MKEESRQALKHVTLSDAPKEEQTIRLTHAALLREVELERVLVKGNMRPPRTSEERSAPGLVFLKDCLDEEEEEWLRNRVGERVLCRYELNEVTKRWKGRLSEGDDCYFVCFKKSYPVQLSS